MQTHSEFLFAHWAVRALKSARGERWQELVEHIAELPATEPDALAFALLMVRLNGCITCDARRFRERGGCAQCSSFTLSTLVKDNEATLLARYRAAHKELAQLPSSSLEKKAV